MSSSGVECFLRGSGVRFLRRVINKQISKTSLQSSNFSGPNDEMVCNRVLNLNLLEHLQEFLKKYSTCLIIRVIPSSQNKWENFCCVSPTLKKYESAKLLEARYFVLSWVAHYPAIISSASHHHLFFSSFHYTFSNIKELMRTCDTKWQTT